jgi:serine/threonine-protein kinase
MARGRGVVDDTRVTPPSPSEDPPRPDRIPPGTVLFGVYEVLCWLGGGGMGDVYKARHLRIGGLRAIKVIRPAFAGRPEAAEFFYREARALLEIHDDAVVRCHDLLTGDDGQVYLVMEMVEGESLSDWIEKGRLSDKAVRALGARIASGLAAAHRRNVVHRDLSPDNILLSGDRPDQAKLIDFGIAKHLESGDLTVVSGFKGKLSYASPEQFGMYGGRVDARSDLYSLGLVLVAAATGSTVPMGATVAEAVHVRQQIPPLPPGLSRELRAEIAPLLAPDPADRPASAEGLFADSSPSPEPPPRRWLLLALAAIAVAGVLIIVPDLRSIFPDQCTRTDNGTETGEKTPPETPRATPPVTPPPTRTETPPPTRTETPPPTRTETPPPTRTTPPAVPPTAFDRVRTQLLELEPVSDTRARIWTAPDPVPDGATYHLHIQADCNCAALLFSIDGSEDKIELLYPNNYDPRKRLVAGEPLILPSPGANPPYGITAHGGGGEDTLKLLLFRRELGFPSDLTFFTTALRGEHLAWTAARGDRKRLEELARVLEGEVWSTAETPLRVVESPAD